MIHAVINSYYPLTLRDQDVSRAVSWNTVSVRLWQPAMLKDSHHFAHGLSGGLSNVYFSEVLAKHSYSSSVGGTAISSPRRSSTIIYVS